MNDYLKEINDLRVFCQSDNEKILKILSLLKRKIAKFLGDTDFTLDIDISVYSGSEKIEICQLLREFYYYRNMLIKGNLKLVVYVARKYLNYSGVEIDDLIQCGNLGLIMATEKYEMEHNTSFSTYAYYWIKNYINQYVNNNYYSVWVSYNKQDLLRKLRKYMADAEVALGRDVKVDDIAKEFHLTYDQALELYTINYAKREEYLNDSGMNDEIFETIRDENAWCEDQTINKEYQEWVVSYLANYLCNSEIEYLKLYFSGVGDVSVNYAMEELGLSKSRIYQIRKTIVKKLTMVPNVKNILLGR